MFKKRVLTVLFFISLFSVLLCYRITAFAETEDGYTVISRGSDEEYRWVDLIDESGKYTFHKVYYRDDYKDEDLAGKFIRYRSHISGNNLYMDLIDYDDSSYTDGFTKRCWDGYDYEDLLIYKPSGIGLYCVSATVSHDLKREKYKDTVLPGKLFGYDIIEADIWLDDSIEEFKVSDGVRVLNIGSGVHPFKYDEPFWSMTPKLKKLELSDSVVSVKCDSLQLSSINFPNGIKHVELTTFVGDGLKMPDSIEYFYLGDGSHIKNIDLSNSLKYCYIMGEANLISELTLPESLKDIEFYHDSRRDTDRHGNPYVTHFYGGLLIRKLTLEDGFNGSIFIPASSVIDFHVPDSFDPSKGTIGFGNSGYLSDEAVNIYYGGTKDSFNSKYNLYFFAKGINLLDCSFTSPAIYAHCTDGDITVFEADNNDDSGNNKDDKEKENNDKTGDSTTVSSSQIKLGGQKIDVSGYFNGLEVKKYKVDNKKIASINKKGILKVKKAGTVKITALSKDKSELKSISIETADKPKLSFKNKSFNQGEEYSIYSYFTTDLKGISANKIESSNTGVASVDSSTGRFVITGTGSTKITAYFDNLKVKSKLKVK